MPAPDLLLLEDADLVAVDKPAGTPVIPLRDGASRACLRFEVERLLGAREGRPARLWVVHRLDRDVSGVLLFARSAALHRALCLAFERGEVRKRYWALVEGVPRDGAGSIDLPLRARAHGNRVRVDRERGKPALTRYRVVERFPRFSVLELEPGTGRTHQIRVHLQAIGHPLAADARYGRRPRLEPADLAGGGPAPGPAGAPRATLHALALQLPWHGAERTITSPLPGDLRALLEALRGRGG